MTSSSTAQNEDTLLVAAVAAAVQAAGRRLLDRFSAQARPASRAAILAALAANDAAALEALRPALAALRPQAGWVEDEEDGGVLPPGEWWVADPAEGNINHIHGSPDWAVTATLVRENLPVLTVVYLPVRDATYTAVRGGGAFLNGARLRVSAKTALDAAVVGTGQAKAGEDPATMRRISQSVATMLEHALLVHVSVPATLQLIQVAAGQTDLFWQYSQVRSGLVAGALLVAEAGGAVTDTRGQPWTLASADFLAAAGGVHAAAVAGLAPIA